MVEALESTGLLANTYMFYWSDHGPLLSLALPAVLGAPPPLPPAAATGGSSCVPRPSPPASSVRWNAGYHLGEFRLAEGKMHFYEFDTRCMPCD